mgnify:CR=1 FL=1|jgi:hypothetical protein
MRRSIRTLLGVTAAAGIVALGVPALAAPAAASSASGTAASTAQFRHWGPYFSANGKAKAQGTVFVKWSPHRKGNVVQVKGRLTDRDFRTLEQGGKCALVRFQLHYKGEPKFAWIIGPSYRWCGADKAPRSFSFTDRDVDGIRAQVCQVPKFGGAAISCGTYKPVYFAKW